MTQTIYLDLYEHVLDRLKRSTQLYARGLNEEFNEETVITDRDEATIVDYFKDFIATLKDETGKHAELKDYDTMLAYNFNEREQKNDTAGISQMLVQICEEYLLYRWYDSLGMVEKGNYHKGKFQEALYNWKYNSTRKKIVKPKYRPYF
jgi:hypothetical protein